MANICVTAKKKKKKKKKKQKTKKKKRKKKERKVLALSSLEDKSVCNFHYLL